MKEILKSTDGFSTMSFDELVLVNGGSDQICTKEIPPQNRVGTSGPGSSGSTGSK